MNCKKRTECTIGKMYDVDGHKMCVYTEGTGNKTVIFMSGAGVCSPILDFKSLYSLLSGTYRIAVIEKFGYGFSDVVEGERPVELILEQSRKALFAAGIHPPYVLCPHSMSGIEAMYWAQTYPEEVSCIIGLDMALPEHYRAMKKTRMSAIKFLKFAADHGATRILPGEIGRWAVKRGTLTEKEKQLYMELFHEKTYNTTVINEGVGIFKSAETVAAGRKIEVPMLLFVSNGNGGTGFKTEKWRAPYRKLISNNPNGRIVELDCPHMMQDYEYTVISRKILSYLKGD